MTTYEFIRRGEVPIITEIISSRRLVVTRATGVLVLDELADRMKKLLAHPEFDPSYDHLFDMSGVTGTEDIRTSELESFALVRIFSFYSRRAIVAPEDLVYGFARMYEVFSHSTEENFAVFRNEEEARAWLEAKPHQSLS